MNGHTATHMEELAGLVQNVNNASKALEESSAGSGAAAAAAARRNLLLEAKKLVASLEEPSTEVWPRAFQVNVGVAVDIAWNMGVWERLEKNRCIALADIVEMTGADEIMIIRIFRHLTAAGVLADAPGPSYVLTSLGEPYLDPDHCSFNRFLLQEIIPTIMSMPETMRERGYKAPTRESGTPFRWAHGEELWTLLGSHPERAANMVRGMKSLSTGALAGDAYPFGEELGRLGIAGADVAVVDVAGGQGHIMEDVRRRHRGVGGRLVVQDLASTLDAVVGGPPPGVEFMAHDMFTPQPVRDAHVYYYRHIVHDWSDEDVARLLRPVVDVLRESRRRRRAAKLLLVDLVLADDKVGMLEAVRDLCMFPVGGLERNETQWRVLLARNGLRIKKIWRGSEPEACVECELDMDD